MENPWTFCGLRARREERRRFEKRRADIVEYGGFGKTLGSDVRKVLAVIGPLSVGIGQEPLGQKDNN